LENLGMKITENVFIVRSGIQSISKFCEIEWEQAYWDDLNTKFVLSEQIYELIEPVYW
jgi:hypothetical protein